VRKISDDKSAITVQYRNYSKLQRSLILPTVST